MSAPTDALLLLRAFCEELARCGMRAACTAPGSRNTPLVLSLVREQRLRCFSHVDERCAGFFALGAAKVSGLPVAVTCTSGTAVANLAPAVIEARQAALPLIVLSADRPPELREVGAGQTIDQVKIFGSAVKWFFEVGVHDATPESIRWMRQLACRAYWAAAQEPAGPVHLNFPLREPLVDEGPLPPDPAPGRAGGRPWVVLEPPVAPAAAGAPAPAAGEPLGSDAVIVAGAGAGPEVANLAADYGIPLLADPLSGLRCGEAAIAHYDLLLRSEAFTNAHRPQAILRVGELPTSKPLRTWLASLEGVEQVAVDPAGRWQDPHAVITRRVRTPPPLVAQSDGWLDSWRRADTRVAEVIEATLGEDLSEPAVAAALITWLPPRATLFVASSMPIRDVEEFAPVRPRAPRILSNRGANGIDGTVSAAFGASAAGDDPVVLLIGDVALAHDLGGLLCGRRLGLRLTIVLLNNDGGGIFHFLPVAGQADAFEEHIATPHGLDFVHAAALYGCGYERVVCLGDLRDGVEQALEAPTTTILEVRTDRTSNLALHRQVAAAVQRALAAPDSG